MRDFFKFDDAILLDPAQTIGNISKIIVLDSAMLIGDLKNTRKVYCYDLRGRLLWSVTPAFISRNEDITDFDVDPGKRTLKIFDGNAIYSFDLNGTYLNSTRGAIWGEKLASLATPDVLVYNSMYDTAAPSSYKIKIVDEKGGMVAAGWPHRVYYPFSNSGMLNLARSPDRAGVLFADLLNDTIYSIDRQAIRRLYALDFGKHSIKNRAAYDGKRLPVIFDLLKKNDESSAIDLLMETDRFFHCAFVWEKKYVSCYYDRRTGRAYLIRPETADPLWHAFPVLPTAVLPDGRFIFVVEPQELRAGATALPAAANRPPVFEKILANTTIHSNPVLVIGKINIR